ncbi:beta-N-acetylhexosaminidase family protein [Streptomyces cavernicola]|uniref:Beta-N-acetylglucosaminidase domain-containing protein n=1 Tax=Streptomyces cavernicola TaxID=3043613 RepID=A0ABT6SBA5_9ACTN|nr:beta-N-acetylglucosaminidase domain-containing protein [Streptomyces sp. B-S-A6]MDI3405481.1 beta-N-acetylglucosaminidase domain-containing protein [Streptomyces sp. B-S-A6]
MPPNDLEEAVPRLARTLTALAVATSVATAGAATAAPDPGARAATAAAAADPLPVVSPTPRTMSRAGDDVPVAGRAEVVVDDRTDAAARRLLLETLRAHGVKDIEIRERASGNAPLTLLLGPAARADVAEALHDTAVPDHAEGYALRVSGGTKSTVALGGTDAAGQFYAVQTLRQLFTRTEDGPSRIAGASVSDRPAMPLRGSIEGFYGPPWTHEERLDQMEFLGDVRANTYVYAPKDDPYHREKWREPYPADKLGELADLVERASEHHVRFTFAVSPGTSICYSDPADTAALTAKLGALYDIGVRSFSIPLDDISYTKWNCAGDEAEFGAPGRGAAAQAQVKLLNTVQREFVEAREGTNPLQMVPTEYGDLTDTAYKETMRSTLDPNVEVMWTGTDVVPPEITNEQAERASELFGRKVFVWDNYPVNDFARTRGRLLMAPYDKREAGLSAHISGLVSNPMNQESASKPAMFTMLDFAWNDEAYDRDASARQAALYLAGGDAHTADAVQRFVDLNHLAPTFGDTPWQPQSPRLTAETAAFWKAYENEPAAAVREFRPVVREIAQVPETLRGDLPDRLFLADSDRWLDATDLWGEAMEHGLNTLAAIEAGDASKAAAERTAMEAAAAEAGKITVDPEEHHQVGPVLLGDPVIEEFLAGVADRHDQSKA